MIFKLSFLIVCYVYVVLCGYFWSIFNRNELMGFVGIEVVIDKIDNDNNDLNLFMMLFIFLKDLF